MANDEDVRRLRQGSAAWNEWRARIGFIRPDLGGADLGGADLGGADLGGADLDSVDLSFVELVGANLNKANLVRADFRGADLSGANLIAANILHANLTDAKLQFATLIGARLFEADLRGAFVNWADLSGANLTGANLTGATLDRANFRGADLSGANLSKAILSGTIFGNVDLIKTIGLDDCEHDGPSIIDFSTLSRSSSLPISFLRGCGLPDNLIEYLPSLRGEAIKFDSCFISYSSEDKFFAERVHSDLQNKGVRCWFAPHDLPIGAKTWDAIDEAIRLRDKLLLILSKASIDSEWVEDEVNKAYAEERSRGEVVLFPIRVDDAVMTTTEPWAVKLRDQRNIGDFRQWKQPEAYQKSRDRLLRNLMPNGA